MAQQQNIFRVIPARDLDAERDAVLALPQESTGKQSFQRVPIRASACIDGAARPQYVPDSRTVVQSTSGLRRLIIRFPLCFCHRIREYDAADGGNADRVNMSLGFALYDHRCGPTAEESRVLENIDRFSAFARNTLFTNDRIRTSLNLGPANMSAEKQRMAAEMLDMWIAKPLADHEASTAGAKKRSRTDMMDDQEKTRARYCYAKIIPAGPTVSEFFMTYWWTPDGRAMTLDRVRALRNFHVEAFVEVEDIFVNKAVKSLQLKLRECIVHPPPERPMHRLSVAFSHRVCAASVVTQEDEIDEPAAMPTTTVAEDCTAPVSVADTNANPPTVAAAVAGDTQHQQSAAAVLVVPVIDGPDSEDGTQTDDDDA